MNYCNLEKIIAYLNPEMLAFSSVTCMAKSNGTCSTLLAVKHRLMTC